MKIASIVGVRPQFIKYFAVSSALKKRKIKDILIHTGQHYDYSMSEVFFKELDIKSPDYHLGVGSGKRDWQIDQIVERSKKILLREKPDIVFVYGDTNSTLGGAIASIKSGIPVAHIEAGLRSYDKNMPEEKNRVLTDHLSSILFCPSKTAVLNLKKEGFSDVPVFNVGDVMHDALLSSVGMAKRKKAIFRKMGLKRKSYCLFTLHRQANVDNKKNFENIIKFINRVSRDNLIVFPMHPRARKFYKKVMAKFSSNVKIVKPLGYLDNIVLLANSKCLFTDSGGMQKEAYWLGVLCVTLRNDTEWPETLNGGWNVLLKNYNGFRKPKGRRKLFYGNGQAADKIAEIIIKWIKKP